MPALPNVAQVIRMDLQQSLGDDADVITRTYFKYSGTAPTAAGCATWANTMCGLWSTDLKALYGTTRGLLGITFTDLTSPTSGTGQFLDTIAGTRSGGALPAGVAALVNYPIARRYRGGKPRSYYPMGTDSDVNTPQTWSTSFQTAVNSALATWSSNIQTNAPSGTTISNQVNVSYYEGFTSVQNPVTLRYRNVNTLRTVPVVDILESINLNLTFGSQRKRNRK